jgi:hypothetical protein
MALNPDQFPVVYHTNLAGDAPNGGWVHAGSRGQAADRLRQVEEGLSGTGFSDPLIGRVSGADQRAATREHVMFGRELNPITYGLEVTGKAMNTPQTPVTDQFANAVTRPVEDIQKQAKDLQGRDLSHRDALLVKLDSAINVAHRDHRRGENYRSFSNEGFNESHYGVSPTQYDILNRMVEGEDPGPVWYLNEGESLSTFGEGELPRNRSGSLGEHIHSSVALPQGSYRVRGSHSGGPNFSDVPAAYQPEDTADVSSLEGVHNWVNRAYPSARLEVSRRGDNLELERLSGIHKEGQHNDVLSLLSQHADRSGLGIVIPDRPHLHVRPSDPISGTTYPAHGFDRIAGGPTTSVSYFRAPRRNR